MTELEMKLRSALLDANQIDAARYLAEVVQERRPEVLLTDAQKVKLLDGCHNVLNDNSHSDVYALIMGGDICMNYVLSFPDIQF